MGVWMKVVIQIIFLWLIYKLGDFIEELLKLPLPGNVLGMLILFGLLCLNIVPAKWIEDGAGILLKHLAFFFIPIAVGLMAWSGLLLTSGLRLFLVLIISAVISIALTGWVVQFFNGRGQGGCR